MPIGFKTANDNKPTTILMPVSCWNLGVFLGVATEVCYQNRTVFSIRLAFVEFPNLERTKRKSQSLSEFLHRQILFEPLRTDMVCETLWLKMTV